MIFFADAGWDKREWNPNNLRLCKRGEWNVHILSTAIDENKNEFLQ